MRSNTDVDSDTPDYPTRPLRWYTSTRQDCFTNDDVTLLQRIRSASVKLSENNLVNYFDTTEETHWYGWWKCIKPAYDSMLRKHDDEPFTLPNREAKDSKAYPLWDFADQTARRIANGQAERARNQNSDLINDPVMLVFEELRDWFYNVLANKECKKEDIFALTRRQSYIKNLIHIIPDFGQDRLRLQEIQQSLDEAYRVTLASIANKELPELLSGIIIDAKGLENTLGTYLHFLLANEKVADNFSPACLDNTDQACQHSPVGKIYQAARSITSGEISDAVAMPHVERYKALNSLYALQPHSDNDGVLQIQPILRTDTANVVNFATFVNTHDKQNYVEALAVLESLGKVRSALENFRKVQSSIGTYFFAYNYMDKTDKLAANYISLVTKANLLLSRLIQSADSGLHKILTHPERYKTSNYQFEKNLRILETSVVRDTTLKDQLDEYCRKAVTSMNHYNNKMAELVSDIHSGKATDEVERAMQELFTQVNDLNAMLSAVLNNKELFIDTNGDKCIDSPFSTACADNLKLLSDHADEPTEETEMLQTSFPTTLDRAISSAKTAAGYGVARGISNLTGEALQANGYSQHTAYYSAQIMYYSLYFSSRVHYDEDNLNAAMYQAAADTVQHWLIGTAFDVTGKLLDQAGSRLEQNEWKQTGNAIKKLGSLVRYGIFACATLENGMVESGAALVAGSAAEVATEKAGRWLIR